MATHKDEEIRSVFEHDPFAIIGCSSTPGKPAHEVPKYLLEQGYEIIPINPTVEEIFTRPSFDSIGEIEQDFQVLTVFRPSAEVAGIVESVVDPPIIEYLWLQLGITDPEAIRQARDAGITVIENQCMKVEHQRLLR